MICKVNKKSAKNEFFDRKNHANQRTIGFRPESQSFFDQRTREPLGAARDKISVSFVLPLCEASSIRPGWFALLARKLPHTEESQRAQRATRLCSRVPAWRAGPSPAALDRSRVPNAVELRSILLYIKLIWGYRTKCLKDIL